MKVRDVMTKHPVTVTGDATVREAASLLRKHRIGGLPVMEGDRLAGIITESDILALLKTDDLSQDLWLPSPLEVIEVPVREFINWEKTRHALTGIGDIPVRDVMSRNPVTAEEDWEIEEAAAVMLREGVARLPVLREGRLTGIVTREDLIFGLAASGGEGGPE
ncbi:MAG: CBS domain-containing protein [Methanoculleaceae archaeon]